MFDEFSLIPFWNAHLNGPVIYVCQGPCGEKRVAQHFGTNELAKNRQICYHYHVLILTMTYHDLIRR